MSPSDSPSVASTPGAKTTTFRGPFALMTVLFFMWGFMTVWNDVLIPRFKEAFALNYFQAMLVQFAFFGAYAVGSLIYYLTSYFWGDPINRIGYKNGVVLGLLISAVGSALFYPAAALVSYPFFLVALFVVGIGFAMLQIAANPYVTILGPERTAPSRLNLSQSFNSFGTTIGPIIGGWLIFNVFTHPGQHGAEAVKLPYLCFAAVFALLAVLFIFARLPAFKNTGTPTRASDVFKYPHFVFGIGAIFMYVGGEVCVGSTIINFLGLPKMGGLPHEAASNYLAYYWGGLMIGRFMGAFSLSEMRPVLKNLLVVLVPVTAFCVVLLASPVTQLFKTGNFPALTEFSASASTSDALHYGCLLAILLVVFYLSGRNASRMLAVFSLAILVLLTIGMTTSGEPAKWSVLGIGLFCSVMWSNIFSLAIESLGALKSQASSLLVMAILGGALLPPTEGAIADALGIQFSFIVPIVAFAYVAFYGLYGYRAGRPQPTA
jgi:FHS family L-fucose permease-like MFS transporter